MYYPFALEFDSPKTVFCLEHRIAILGYFLRYLLLKMCVACRHFDKAGK